MSKPKLLITTCLLLATLFTASSLAFTRTLPANCANNVSPIQGVTPYHQQSVGRGFPNWYLRNGPAEGFCADIGVKHSVMWLNLIADFLAWMLLSAVILLGAKKVMVKQ